MIPALSNSRSSLESFKARKKMGLEKTRGARNSKEGQSVEHGERESMWREKAWRARHPCFSHVPCFLAPYKYFSSTGWKVYFFLEANTKAIRFILLQFCPFVLLVAFEHLFSLLFSVLINPMPFQSVIFSRPCNSQLLTLLRRSRYWRPLM